MPVIRSLTDDTNPVETTAKAVLDGENVTATEAREFYEALTDLVATMEKEDVSQDKIPYKKVIEATSYGKLTPVGEREDKIRQAAENTLTVLDERAMTAMTPDQVSRAIEERRSKGTM